MAMLELPHSYDCLVCGRTNPHGLKMSLFVDPDTGIVHTKLTARHEHVGFAGVIHGGILATIVDEAMVWCATWQIKRFCVAAEMNCRFLQPVSPGMTIRVEAKIDRARPRLVTTTSTVMDEAGATVFTASGKYMPVAQSQHVQFAEAMVPESATFEASRILQS